MTEHDLVQTMTSLDGRLDDVRREQSWRAIDRALDAAAPVAPTRPARRFAWPIAFGVAAATAAVLALLLVRRPTAPVTAPVTASTPPPASAPTELVAAAGQHTVLDRDGVTLTLVGPGAATIDRDADAMRVRVARGTLVADRTDAAPTLAISAGGTTTTSRDRRFAIHVSSTTIVLGADERADQIVARYAFAEAPTPTPTLAPEPTPTPEPTRKPEPTLALEPEPTPARKPTPTPTPLATQPSPSPVLPALKLDAAELYRRAETSLAIHDPITARAQLEQLLREAPDHPLVDAARYDLALLARTYGERARALELLEQIRTSGRDANVRAAAARLEAQIRASR